MCAVQCFHVDKVALAPVTFYARISTQPHVRVLSYVITSFKVDYQARHTHCHLSRSHFELELPLELRPEKFSITPMHAAP